MNVMEFYKKSDYFKFCVKGIAEAKTLEEKGILFLSASAVIRTYLELGIINIYDEFHLSAVLRKFYSR
jgi:hypothetical protein